MLLDGQVRAVVFDVFGTCVDWCAGVARESEEMLAPMGWRLDWVAFANRWRSEYQPAMAAVREHGRPYVTMDVLHREMLDPALADFGVTGLGELEKRRLSLAWRRLDPWPDVPAALLRLKRRAVIAPLSNANTALSVALARRGGLPWDAVLGAEIVQTYKPAPEVYDSAPRLLDLAPGEVMLVACHVWDLRAAAARGLRTAFVPRPDEYGPGAGGPSPEPGEFNLQARDFHAFADQLGA